VSRADMPERLRSSARVLVADDDPDVRDVLSRYLTGFGYEVLLTETAIGALGLVRSHCPDVVLLDLAMPGAVAGESVVAAIAREAPVIVISALHDLDVARGTLRSGAFDFVMKPFRLAHVRRVVEAALTGGPRRAYDMR